LTIACWQLPLKARSKSEHLDAQVVCVESLAHESRTLHSDQ
jgi:hypothetical protein